MCAEAFDLTLLIVIYELQFSKGHEIAKEDCTCRKTAILSFDDEEGVSPKAAPKAAVSLKNNIPSAKPLKQKARPDLSGLSLGNGADNKVSTQQSAAGERIKIDALIVFIAWLARLILLSLNYIARCLPVVLHISLCNISHIARGTCNAEN